jgi:hypothetical protein
MQTLFEQFKAHIDTVDLGEVATDGIDAYKDVMREKVPQGLSPVKNGVWVEDLNISYSIKKAKRFTDFADLNIGEKRYVKLFNRVQKTANSATFDYDNSYSAIASRHQEGVYEYGESVKPRELIPQTKDELPEKVLEAVKKSFLERL